MKLETKELSQRLVGVLFLTTIAPAAIEKFAGGETPKWFIDQFATTFLARLPGGLPLAFFGIATLEALAAALVLGGLFGRKPILSNPIYRLGLIYSEVLFIALAFGQRLTHKYDEAAFLFVYAFLTFIVLALPIRSRVVAEAV